MHPFARDRRFWTLIGYAVPIGLFSGAAGLAFVTAVRLGTDLLWPQDLRLGLLEGEPRWILTTTVAGLLVGTLRRWLRVTQDPTGALAAIQTARVDHRTAVQTVVVSAVSLIGGASLGPFDAGTRAGGALGEWVSARRRLPEDMRDVNALSGISGGIGGLLTAPFLATLLVLEIARPDPRRLYSFLVPNLVAALFGFLVFFTTVGVGFLRLFEVPGFVPEPWHLLAAVGLGAVAAFIALTLGTAIRIARHLAGSLPLHPVALAGLGGAVLGVIGVAFPLTLASGKEQLTATIQDAQALGAALLIGVTLAKIVAMAVSLSTGFIGGPVMPTLFIGGTSGLAIHLLFPQLPVALAFSSLLVAVAGATLKAPFSMVLLVAFTVGIGPIETVPAGIAVVTSYLLTSGLGLFGTPQAVPAPVDARAAERYADGTRAPGQ